MQNRIALALLGVALLFPQENVEAQCRNLFARHQVFVPVVQQQVVYSVPQVHYFLGSDIQLDALAEKIAPRLSDQLAPKIIAGLRAAGVNLNTQQLPDGNGVPTPAADQSVLRLSPAVKARPVFVAKCLRCHIGDDPKGGVSFENGMTDAQFRKFVGFFRSPAAAPKGMQGVLAGLSAADKGAIAEELYDFVIPDGPAINDVPAPPIPTPDGNEGQGDSKGGYR